MLSYPRQSEKKFLFSKHNFEIIWFSRPFGYFWSPECIQIMIRGLFFAKEWPVFQVKILTPKKNLWHLCKYYMNAEKQKIYIRAILIITGSPKFKDRCFVISLLFN